MWGRAGEGLCPRNLICGAGLVAWDWFLERVHLFQQPGPFKYANAIASWTLVTCLCWGGQQQGWEGLWFLSALHPCTFLPQLPLLLLPVLNHPVLNTLLLPIPL
jgi:hypothetical protein